MRKYSKIIFLLSVLLMPGIFRAQIWERCSKTHSSNGIFAGSGKTIFSLSSHLFVSLDLGSLFQVASLSDANPNGFATGSAGTYFVTTPRGLYTSTDKGDNWVKTDTRGIPTINTLLVREARGIIAEDEIFLGTDSGIYYRRFSTKTWTKLFNSEVPVLQIAAFDSNIYCRAQNDVYMSHDTGRTWNLSLHVEKDITGLVSTSNDDVFIAINAYPGGTVLHSSNSGMSWDGSLTISISNHTFRTLITNQKGDIYLAGGIRDSIDQNNISQAYVLRLLSGTTTWSDYSAGLPLESEIISVGFSSPEYGKVFASTDSSGTFRTILPSKVTNREIESGIFLSQNFPNPVTSTTQFSVSVDHPTKAYISLFDALGRNMSEISNGELTQGEHTFSIDVKNLPNGTYFYRIQTEKTVLSRPFIINK
jgi:hypothetical protein